jgi:hypothetical protein
LLTTWIGADPDVAQAGWELLQRRRKSLLYEQPQLAEGEVLPPVKRLKEAS